MRSPLSPWTVPLLFSAPLYRSSRTGSCSRRSYKKHINMQSKKYRITKEEKTHHKLPRPIQQLLIQLHQIKPVLRLSRLDVHFAEEFADYCYHLRESLLVDVVLWRVLVYSFEQEWIPRETRCRFREIAIKLELARLRETLCGLRFRQMPATTSGKGAQCPQHTPQQRLQKPDLRSSLSQIHISHTADALHTSRMGQTRAQYQ